MIGGGKHRAERPVDACTCRAAGTRCDLYEGRHLWTGDR